MNSRLGVSRTLLSAKGKPTAMRGDNAKAETSRGSQISEEEECAIACSSRSSVTRLITDVTTSPISRSRVVTCMSCSPLQPHALLYDPHMRERIEVSFRQNKPLMLTGDP